MCSQISSGSAGTVRACGGGDGGGGGAGSMAADGQIGRIAARMARISAARVQHFGVAGLQAMRAAWEEQAGHSPAGGSSQQATTRVPCHSPIILCYSTRGRNAAPRLLIVADVEQPGRGGQSGSSPSDRSGDADAIWLSAAPASRSPRLSCLITHHHAQLPSQPHAPHSAEKADVIRRPVTVLLRQQ
ncbi:hypothetical protein WOLCODRAFT_157204 [Wolfiporia cocos MD-104 SS10]|uniref:Uncharacterized protein n=1 Tax=Wolfiporia cocos (strain MD-104) TaxID=742152 RepID=A0A2H3J2L4_WOLCO|nr:hypothetical protein WOLCODRAFT_157204 [Wolfiporia cocos MD-104 SS10]